MKLFILFCTTLSLMAECAFHTSSFVAHESEAIEKKTGLTWSRCSLGQEWQKGKGCAGEIVLMDRKEANDRAETLGKGWRLPTIDELSTLVDARCKSPVINSVLFGKLHDTGEGANYLSASVYLEGDDVIPTLFYTINFLDGSVDAHTKGYRGAVRLVR